MKSLSEQKMAPDPADFIGLRDTVGVDVALDVLQVYINSASQLIGDLQSAVKWKDKDMTLARISELNNSCTVIGAQRMAGLCQDVDEMARVGNWSRVSEVMVDLNFEYRHLLEFLRKIWRRT